jgi:DNA-binding response OmpR family regulator
MVVEDDASVRELVSKALSTKYRVITANDGLAAAEMLGSETPDLIICDVMMPRVDGFSLAKMIRDKAELKNVPIIFLTAKQGAQAMAQGIQLGARAYLSKPFSVKDLVDKVDKLLV